MATAAPSHMQPAAVPLDTQPTPDLFFQTVTAFQQSEALKAAIELDLFSGIGQDRKTAATLAAQIGAAERGVRIVCDYLTILGFLRKEDERYSLTADSAMFLDRGSRAYLGDAVHFLMNPQVRDAHARMADAVRQGGTAVGEGTLIPENPEWVTFARAMMPMMFMPAQGIADELRRGGESHKVLDIAAGHGIFGISVAQRNPQAQVYGADWKNVLTVAQENANRMGVGDRYHTLPGSAFDVDFGTGYDLVLIPNFLHHFDAATCTRFLAKVRAALEPGGRAAIVEFVPNDDRISPAGTASFSMMMLATTPSGDAYTFREFERFALDAGFARVERTQHEFGMSTLIVAHR